MTNDRKNLQLSYCIGHKLHRASQRSDDVFAGAANGIDLTARQLTVLEIVDQIDKPSQMDICAISGIDRSTIADMVLRLINKGLIERSRSREDARRYALRLTDAGREMIARARPVAKKAEAELLTLFTADSTKRLLDDLQALAFASEPARN